MIEIKDIVNSSFSSASPIEPNILFGVPIFVGKISNFETVKPLLVDLAYRVRGPGSEGVKRSNCGGWHSELDVHVKYKEVIGQLMECITEYSNDCVKSYLKTAKFGTLKVVSSWINVNSQGHWNMPHAHGAAAWSGVLCIQNSSKLTDKEIDRGGELIFLNPSPQREIHSDRPLSRHCPKEGEIYIFPGYLMHMVSPLTADEDRMSLAFNMKFHSLRANKTVF